jgi:hypothetical protein
MTNMKPGKSQCRASSARARFVEATLAGSVVSGVVCTVAPPEAQIASLGVLTSALMGLVLAGFERDDRRDRAWEELLRGLRVPIALVARRELFEQYVSLSDSLARIARTADPVVREAAEVRLANVVEELGRLAAGTLIFDGTESWRAVYERLLDRPDVTHYRSAAWVRTADYWRDMPGRQSMELNYALARRGVQIERVLILPEELWPEKKALPSPLVRGWIDEQLLHGITLSLVREERLRAEPDLLRDFGIYGDVATGLHELDPQSRTLRFVVSFDPQNLRIAEDRWERLRLFALPYPQPT